MRYIFFAILIYVAYRFIFNLVIPVYRATGKIKKGFREMHDQMKEKMDQQKTDTATTAGPGSSKPLGDYIDFEEVK